MIELLSKYVPNFNGRKTTINGYTGYADGNSIYFILPLNNNEEIYYEQKVVSDFLKGSGTTIASPIFTMQGQLTTKHGEQDYVVYQGQLQERPYIGSHGHTLATFHQNGIDYPYQPNYISSYGQWKTLWINKTEAFESIYNQQYHDRPVSHFQRLFIDTFPYIIGLSENAIQYLQESEQDSRFDESDQPTITFQRYQNQTLQQIVWSDDLVYDHPVRDIAEHVRFFLLHEEEQSFQKVTDFLTEYQQIRSFSIFSWRLLYARLLFPIHLYDYIEMSMARSDQEANYNGYKQLLEKQSNYEKNVKYLFKSIGNDNRNLQIPVLDW